MRRAPEPLVRCHLTVSTRQMVREIMAHTRQQQWEVIHRAVRSLWLALLHPEKEGSAGAEEVRYITGD